MTNQRPEYGDRWFFVVFFVIVLTLFLAKFARADETLPASMPSSAPAALVVPLMAGETATFAGLLVPESIFIGYLRQDILITELKMKIEIRDRMLLEKPLVTKMPPTFGVGWSFVVGMGVGIVASALIVYGAVAILKATP